MNIKIKIDYTYCEAWYKKDRAHTYLENVE